VLALAAAVQQGSSHPLARAVLQAAQAEKLDIALATEARALPGRGVQARVGPAILSVVSSAQLLELELGLELELELKPGLALAEPGKLINPTVLDSPTSPTGLAELAGLADVAAQCEAAGQSVSWLVRSALPDAGPELLGMLAFGDKIKPTSEAAITSLRLLGIRSVLLSGDNWGSARAVAKQLGIEEVHAQVLPLEKAALITALRQSGACVAMVGDGINDAPALAAADVSIAMANGTDVAMAAAGITLMRGDPALVADALDVSRCTYAKIRQGLFWAFIYNLLGIPLAALGYLSPVLAGAAMAMSSVSVVSNALLLRRWRGRA